MLVRLVSRHHRHVHLITVCVLLRGREPSGVSHCDAKCRLRWRLCYRGVFWGRARPSDTLFRYVGWMMTTHNLSFSFRGSVSRVCFAYVIFGPGWSEEKKLFYWP